VGMWLVVLSMCDDCGSYCVCFCGSREVVDVDDDVDVDVDD